MSQAIVPELLHNPQHLPALIERGTKPDALGRKPCHRTSTLKAAMVKAKRAWKIGPAPMHDLFEMADERQHGEPRLDEHPVLPLPALTQFEIGGIALRGMEAGITQDNHLLLPLPNQPLKRVIGDIGPVAGPPHD